MENRAPIKRGIEGRMTNPLCVDSLAVETFVAIRTRWNITRLAHISLLALVGLPAIAPAAPADKDSKYVLDRENRTVVVEPYGPNIVRITLSTDKSAAVATPGYGIT